MDNSDKDLETTCEPGSREVLLSLDAEVRERLDDCYAQIEFLEGTSAAIHDHLQHNFYSSSHGDEGEIMTDTEDVAHDDSDDNQHYYDQDFNNGDADEECYDDFQEEDDEGGYEDWDGNDHDEYYR